jgi:hypothetical protein
MTHDQNPFTDPRDANLAAAWAYGHPIGKRRERILIALFAVALIVIALAWRFS